ncbi:fam96b-like protein [Ophiostoma piceae UAMH 11346]|uniref:Fam96b-like protein n=1 Tax=Ophiostoma piceae (strain UAMH 11346) TaxID=1262450 RepID=S3CDH4_OPHP1|nr:fam96b-like protein [Ophiostoma piceae UAMH 11346]
MAELQNANPTIINSAQLPSRRLGKSTSTRRGPEFKYDGILTPANAFGARAPSPPSSLSSASSGGDVFDDVDAYFGSNGADDEVFTEEPIDEQEIYDPEHPHTLGQLSVVNLPDIRITPSSSSVADRNSSTALTQVIVYVTPTINHCSLVTVIGLAIRVRLEQTLPPNYRVDIQVKEGSHAQDDQVTKQLSDKERVAAALENDTLRGVLDKMLETCK